MTLYKGYRIHAPAEGWGLTCAEPEWNESENRRAWFNSAEQARAYVDAETSGQNQVDEGQGVLF